MTMKHPVTVDTSNLPESGLVEYSEYIIQLNISRSFMDMMFESNWSVANEICDNSFESHENQRGEDTYIIDSFHGKTDAEIESERGISTANFIKQFRDEYKLGDLTKPLVFDADHDPNNSVIHMIISATHFETEEGYYQTQLKTIDGDHFIQITTPGSELESLNFPYGDLVQAWVQKLLLDIVSHENSKGAE